MKLKSFLEQQQLFNDHGATMVEYAMLCALVATALIVAINSLAQGLSASFSNTTSALNGVNMGTSCPNAQDPMCFNGDGGRGTE
jgi:Flp pilus assembly pilin Flp